MSAAACQGYRKEMAGAGVDHPWCESAAGGVTISDREERKDWIFISFLSLIIRYGQEERSSAFPFYVYLRRCGRCIYCVIGRSFLRRQYRECSCWFFWGLFLAQRYLPESQKHTGNTSWNFSGPGRQFSGETGKCWRKTCWTCNCCFLPVFCFRLSFIRNCPGGRAWQLVCLFPQGLKRDSWCCGVGFLNGTIWCIIVWDACLESGAVIF